MNWIDAEKEQPKEFKQYLVSDYTEEKGHEGTAMTVMTFDPVGSKWINQAFFWKPEDVTRWAHIEKPKK